MNDMDMPNDRHMAYSRGLQQVTWELTLAYHLPKSSSVKGQRKCNDYNIVTKPIKPVKISYET